MLHRSRTGVGRLLPWLVRARARRSAGTVARLGLSAWLVLSVGACASAPQRLGPPPVSSGKLFTPSDEVAPYAHDERMSARVHVLGMHAGEVGLSLKRSCAKQRVIVQSEGRSVGLAKLFSDRKTSARTPVDPDTGLPLRYNSVLSKGDEAVRYQLRFKPGQYRWKREKTGQEKQRGKRSLPGKSNAHTFESAFLALRYWRPSERMSESLLVVLGRRLYELEVRYTGAEPIEYAGARRGAVRIDGTLYKIDLNPNESQRPRQFSVWFTDDERRLPLRAVGSTGMGDVRVELDSYQARPPAVCPQLAAQ